MDEDRLKRFQDTGIFVESGMVSAPSIPLGIFFTSCHFWKPDKICQFLIKPWDEIKDPIDEEKIKKLEDELNSKSEYAIPLDKNKQPNWLEVLGDDWEILKIGLSKSAIAKIESGDEDSKLVVQLLRQIRNKHSHCNQLYIKNKSASQLGWFPDGEFDNSAFVTYWAQKFPKLIPFFWLNLYQTVIHKKLSNCYSYLLRPVYVEHMSNRELDMDVYLELLHVALLDHLESGGLVKRFHNQDSTGTVTHILEFRTLPLFVIQAALNDENASVIMHVRNDCVSINWYHIDTTLDKKLEYTLQKPNTNPFREKTTTFVVVNSSQDKFLMEECKNKSHVIVLFSENANREPLVAKDVYSINGVNLFHNPLKWMELSEKTKLRLEEGEVKFHNKITKIKNILPHFDNEVIFAKLEGNAFINSLLLEEKPVIFDKPVLPTLVSTYIGRKIFRTCKVTSKVLRHRELDIFVVTNIEPELLEEKVKHKEKIQLIEHLESFMSEEEDFTARIYYTLNCDLRNILKIIGLNHKKRRFKIHFLRYVEEELFEWLGTFGSHSIIKKSFAKMTDKALDEKVFIDKIMNGPIAPIFITDKPGMGKSLLLTSLANIICENYNKSFVLHFQIADFVGKMPIFEKGKLEKRHIESVIIDALCSTSFEKHVIAFWLQENKITSTSMKFELMLDGLDELDKEQKDLALGILKVIHHEFSSIRLWVTLREHMIEELEDHFSVIVYKILPFTENDQIRFLQGHWKSKQAGTSYSSQELFHLAQNCVTWLMSKGIETEIAGAPLQCRMLAEIFENNLSSVADGNNIHLTLTKMYEGMIEKKLRECLKEKQGCQQLNEHYVSLIRKEMERNHMYLAIKLLFSDKTSELFCETMGITSEEKDVMETTVKDEGIIQNLKPLIFIHRTFAEYFVALFIYKVLKGDFARLGLKAKNLDFQYFFINQVLEISTSKQQLSERKFISKFKFPVLCYFLNAMLDNQNMVCPEMESMMMKAHDFQQNVFESPKSVILATLQGNYFNMAKLIFESLTEPTKNVFMNRMSDMPEFLLEASLRCTDVDFFKYICSTIEAWYELNHADAYKIPENIFKLSLGKGKFEMAKFLIEMRGFDSNRWASLRVNDNKKKHGIVHWIMNKSRHDEDEVLTEKKKLLQYVFDIDPSLIEQKDIAEETPLFMPPPSVNFGLKKFLITDLHANVNAIGKYKNTPFHWEGSSTYKNSLTPEGYHEMLETFLLAEFSQINMINQRGCTPLHCAIKTFDDSLLKKTLELFQKGNADFNIKDKTGSTVLHFCIRQKCSLSFIKKLIDCGSDIYVRNSEGLCALDLAREKKYKALEETLLTYYKAVDIKNMEE